MKENIFIFNFFRYIGLLSRVLEWQKLQERNNKTNGVTSSPEIRIKCEPQQHQISTSHHHHQHLYHHHHHHHHQNNNSSLTYQVIKTSPITCFKQETRNGVTNYTNQNSPNIDKTNRNGNLLMVANSSLSNSHRVTSSIPVTTSCPNFSMDNHQVSIQMMNGIASTRSVNGKHSSMTTTAATTTTTTTTMTTQQHIVSSSSSSSCANFTNNNGCNIGKRLKTEIDDEDEITSLSKMSSRKRFKITFGKNNT